MTSDPTEGVDADGYVVTGVSVDRVPFVSELSVRHVDVVREVGLAQATPSDLLGDADACFLKHYCVPLAGRDRRPELPRCKPSRALADGFNGDLPTLVQTWRTEFDGATTPAQRMSVATRAARRLLLAVATVESVSHETWSTDRATGAALLARHHPEWAGAGYRALRRATEGGSVDGVEELFQLGEWLAGHP